MRNHGNAGPRIRVAEERVEQVVLGAFDRYIQSEAKDSMGDAGVCRPHQIFIVGCGCSYNYNTNVMHHEPLFRYIWATLIEIKIYHRARQAVE